jgi:hypothetical protein
MESEKFRLSSFLVIRHSKDVAKSATAENDLLAS